MAAGPRHATSHRRSARRPQRSSDPRSLQLPRPRCRSRLPASRLCPAEQRCKLRNSRCPPSCARARRRAPRAAQPWRSRRRCLRSPRCPPEPLCRRRSSSLPAWHLDRRSRRRRRRQRHLSPQCPPERLCRRRSSSLLAWHLDRRSRRRRRQRRLLSPQCPPERQSKRRSSDSPASWGARLRPGNRRHLPQAPAPRHQVPAPLVCRNAHCSPRPPHRENHPWLPGVHMHLRPCDTCPHARCTLNP